MNGADHAPLAARIRKGENLVGLLIKMPNPALVEVAGHLGFDLVVIDQEHGRGDVFDLEHHLRAADAVGVDVVVRVGSLDGSEILRVLDAGAKGIIVPHVSSADEAEQAVRLAHYPPRGSRGVATSTRAGGFSTGDLDSHLRRAANETVVIVQVEDPEAVAQVKKIGTVGGVDAVFLGPTDLSVSLGHPGDAGHPAVRAAVDAVVDGVVSLDETRLCVIVESGQEVADWRERGASISLFMATSLQVAALRSALHDSQAVEPSPIW